MVLADAARINSQIEIPLGELRHRRHIVRVGSPVLEQLSQHKVEHIYRITGGAHAYPVWQRNLNDVAPMLFAENDTGLISKSHR